MKECLTTLPSYEEMLKRLLKVNQSEHMREMFFPLLLDCAGQICTSSRIVMILAIALEDASKDLDPLIKGMMHDQIPQFVEALVEDEEAVKEVKEIWKKTLFTPE